MQRLDLSDLPNEILDQIFSLLPVPDAATRASFHILVVSPLLSDAEIVQALGNRPDIAPTVKSLNYVTDTLAEPQWRRAESSPPLIEEIAPEEYTWNATDHPRNWLPHYVSHPEGSGRINLLSPEWYQYRYRPLISYHRRSTKQIALDRERYEEILLDQAEFLAVDDTPKRDHEGIVMCLEKFSALENITLAACREMSLAAPLNSVPLHSDRIPFRYAPWQTAFPNISTPETEERVMRSLVGYLEDQSVQGRSFLKTLQIKNLSWCVLDAPGLFSTSIVGPALANLTTLEIQIRHGNPIHVAANECIPPMSQARLSHVMSSGRVREFLKALPNLRHLTFERDRVWYRDEQTFPEGHWYRWSLGDIIDPEFQWPYLQSLSLSHFDNCERQDIERIMENHTDTLWKVSLGDATLRTTSWVNVVDYFYQENQKRIAGYDDKPLYHLELWGCLRGTREKDISGNRNPDAMDHAGEGERWSFWRGETHSWEPARYVYGIAFQVSLFAREHKALYARVLAGQREKGLRGLEA